MYISKIFEMQWELTAMIFELNNEMKIIINNNYDNIKI